MRRLVQTTFAIVAFVLAGGYSRIDAQAASAASMLLHAAADSGYVYLSWNDIDDASSYQVEWKRSNSATWESVGVEAPAYHKSILGLENGVTYQFRVSASTATGSLGSATIQMAPTVRLDCDSPNLFACSVNRANAFLSSSRGKPPFRCEGEIYEALDVDTPNCAFTSGTDLFGFDRYVSNVFRDLPVPSRDVVRAAARRAMWGPSDPFNSPELFPPSLRALGVPDLGLVGSSYYGSAETFLIRTTLEISSRFTIYTPLEPIPGQFMVFMDGHGLTANTSSADVLEWFLVRGWTVASMDMPLDGANAVDMRFPVDSHDAFRFYPAAQQRPLDVFLLPVKFVIDHLLERTPASNPHVVLAGRSGGGGVACMYGAIDERVTAIIDISGCWPRTISLDPSLLSNPNVLHYETLLPRIFDKVSMLEMIISAGTRGNFHFYSSNDPSIRYTASNRFIRYLKTIASQENAAGATVNRTRVHIGTQTKHGLDALAYQPLEAFLRGIGLPADVVSAPVEPSPP